MSNAKTTLPKRLDRLAEVLTGTTLSQYAHTVYEASAELDGQAAQIAMLREALHVGRALTMGYINGALTEKSKDEATADLQIINAALNATAADVEAWQAAQVTTAEPVALSAIAEWDTAPAMTQYGAGMMQAVLAISHDETLTLTCHRDALRLPSPF